MAKEETTAGTISAQDAAKLLMLEGPRWIQKLAQDGYIQKTGRDRYLTVSVVQGYIRFLKEERKSESRNASENRVRDARAREIEIRTAKADRELVELEEVTGVFDEVVGALKRETEGLAATVTRDMVLRKKIEDAIDEVFQRASARIVKAIGALGEGRSPLEADEEDDA